MAAHVPEHRIPADADAGGEGPSGEPESLADGSDPLRQAVEIRLWLLRLGQLTERGVYGRIVGGASEAEGVVLVRPEEESPRGAALNRRFRRVGACAPGLWVPR